MINRIVVEIKPQTMSILAELAAIYHTTAGQIAGAILDAKLAYQLEIERMCPPTVRAAERTTMTLTPAADELEKIKISKARWLVGQLLLSQEMVDMWPDEDVAEYLEADGYLWIDGEWRTTEDVNLVPAL